MKVGFHPAAAAEFRAAAAYYEERLQGLGEEFIVEVEHMRSLLTELQGLGPKIDSLHRRVSLRRFPYSVIYRVDGAELSIVAVANKRRRPGYWKGRK